jgi:hypothetical protein
VCASLFVCWPDAAAFAQAADNQAAAFTAFAEKIGRYERLRARLEERLPTLEGQRRSWSVMLMRRYLASAVRTARPRAQIGDVFTPPIAAVFRHALVDAVYDVDIEGLVPDESDVVVDLVVNEPVPEWALDRLPMPLLDRLPALPEGIEYRVVSGSLVLWDVHAEILIDTLPNAFVTTDPEDGEQR